MQLLLNAAVEIGLRRGSAMAAATYAAALTGRTGFGGEIVVLNQGGRVLARAEADGMVTVQGNATFEWEGTVEVDVARGTASGLLVTERFGDEVMAWGRVVAAQSR